MADEPEPLTVTGSGSPDAGEGIPSSILFLCRMNAIRSPMAEALARSILPPTVFISSAGVRPGEADPFVGALLASEGLAQYLHPPRGLDDLDDSYFDLIVTLAPEAHQRALDMTRAHATAVEYWPTPDPSSATGTREQILSAYRDVLAHLRARIVARFPSAGRK